MSDKIGYIARKFIEEGVDFAIATIVETKGSTPRKKGAALIMDHDGNRWGTVGGGLIEAETEKLLKKTLESRERTRIYDFMLDEKKTGPGALEMGCGGDAAIRVDYIDHNDPGNFVNEFKLSDKAFLFGGGHVALALDPVLRHVDFDTTIIDDRAEYANKERFPESDIVVIDNFDHCFDDIEVDENSYLIIVTRGHKGDLQVLREALQKPHAYLGMIGSKGKNKILFDALLKEGVSQELLDGIYTPIGLKIGAETPEEIGVSIAAEMIQVRANR